MKILGDSIQEGIPMPDELKEIKTTTKIIIEGQNGERQEIELPKEKIDGFIKEDGKWYIWHLERRNK